MTVTSQGGAPRIGPWELLRKLGQGTFGAVYEARSESDGQRAALKLLLAGEAQDEARFAREVELLRRLSDPGLARLLDAGRLGTQPWFAMELVPGETLKARLRRGPLEPGEAARLVGELARTVAVVHAQGVVHRDIKPSNVILEPGGRPRLTDFGLASGRGEGGSLTRTGDQLGTPLYMAPEQFQDAKRAGPPADVWALGAILYECLTGRPPFLAEHMVDVARLVQETDPVPPRLLRPQVWPGVEIACLRALARDPAARPDATGLHAALELATPGAPHLAGSTERLASGRLASGRGALATERWPQARVVAPILAARARGGPELRRPRRTLDTVLLSIGLVLAGAAAGLLVAWLRRSDAPPPAPPGAAAAPSPAPETAPPLPSAPPAAAEPPPAPNTLLAAEAALAAAPDELARSRAARRVLGALQARGRLDEALGRARAWADQGGPFASEARLRAACLVVFRGAGPRQLAQDDLAHLAGDPGAGPSGVVAAALRRALGGQEVSPSELELALEQEPELGPARQLLAQVLARLGRTEQALAVLEEGLRRIPGDAELIWTLVSLRQERRETDVASQLLDQLIELGGDEPDYEALYQRARMDLHRGRWAGAVGFLDRALVRRPGELTGLLMRGLCRWSLGQQELADADWRDAALCGQEPFQRELERRYRDPRQQALIWERALLGLRLRLPLPPPAGTSAPDDPDSIARQVEALATRDPLGALARAEAALARQGADAGLLQARTRAWCELAARRGAWEAATSELTRLRELAPQAALPGAWLEELRDRHAAQAANPR